MTQTLIICATVVIVALFALIGWLASVWSNEACRKAGR